MWVPKKFYLNDSKINKNVQKVFIVSESYLRGSQLQGETVFPTIGGSCIGFWFISFSSRIENGHRVQKYFKKCKWFETNVKH